MWIIGVLSGYLQSCNQVLKTSLEEFSMISSLSLLCLLPFWQFVFPFLYHHMPCFSFPNLIYCYGRNQVSYKLQDYMVLLAWTSERDRSYGFGKVKKKEHADHSCFHTVTSEDRVSGDLSLGHVINLDRENLERSTSKIIWGKKIPEQKKTILAISYAAVTKWGSPF